MAVDRHCGRRHAIKNVVALGRAVRCWHPARGASYQTAAMQASEGGDRKAAISLAMKKVAQFSRPDECSRTTGLNYGTLAQAYGTLAGYQILDGDSTAGEGSFSSAKGALGLADPGIGSSATAMVYRDVSEAFWKVGDRTRAVVVFEGRAAGADKWLFMSSAAQAADQQPTDQQSTDSH